MVRKCRLLWSGNINITHVCDKHSRCVSRCGTRQSTNLLNLRKSRPSNSKPPWRELMASESDCNILSVHPDVSQKDFNVFYSLYLYFLCSCFANSQKIWCCFTVSKGVYCRKQLTVPHQKESLALLMSKSFAFWPLFRSVPIKMWWNNISIRNHKRTRIMVSSATTSTFCSFSNVIPVTDNN